MKISVIVPVYNGERFLGECLDSVLAQDIREIEVICCNDGSTDGTGAMLDGYRTADDRVRVLDLKHVGSGRARNAGLEAATGKYVAFMDGDDKYPDTSTLRSLYEAAESSGRPIAGGNIQMFSADREVQVVSYGPGVSGLEGCVRYADYQLPYGFTCYVYDREFLDSHGIRFLPLVRYEDPGFFVRAMVAAGTFFSLNRTTYLYRVSHKAVDWAEDGYRKADEHLRGLDDMLGLIASNGLPRLAEWVVGDLSTMLGDAAAIGALDGRIRALLQKCRNGGLVSRDQWMKMVRGFASHEPKAVRRRLRRAFFGRFFLFKLALFRRF